MALCTVHCWLWQEKGKEGQSPGQTAAKALVWVPKHGYTPGSYALKGLLLCIQFAFPFFFIISLECHIPETQTHM